MSQSPEKEELKTSRLDAEDYKPIVSRQEIIDNLNKLMDEHGEENFIGFMSVMSFREKDEDGGIGYAFQSTIGGGWNAQLGLDALRDLSNHCEDSIPDYGFLLAIMNDLSEEGF